MKGIDMITTKRQRRRVTEAVNYSVWAEPTGDGRFVIYCGISGTEKKTIAGAANSRESLEYNIRKVKHKFGVKL